MDLHLDGRRAIITGGSRGIGLAVARGLAAEGAHLALVARDPARLQAAAQTLASYGRTVLTKVADTTDDLAVRAMVGEVADGLGGVDILVNCAAQPGGTVPPAKLADLSDDAIRAELETKLLGYLRCARAVAPYMQRQGWGRIISVSGLAARQAGSVAGSVRNVAVAAMTKNLADELGPDGINVTVVHPGSTVTERTAGLVSQLASANNTTEEEARARLASASSIGRMVTADEVAAVVTFLASPLSVAINGDAIAVGGGARGAIHY
jgi:NAD(P)-dependent dehydrogenase (short-subunit alcohol dehydrogenase family)